MINLTFGMRSLYRVWLSNGGLGARMFRATRPFAAPLWFLVAIAGFLTSQAEAAPALRRIKGCADCPSMVIVPGGHFLIGSPDTEPGRHKNEGPQRNLQIESVAISETEITRKQFSAFVRATRRHIEPGCDTQGDGTDGNWDRVPSASWLEPGFTQTDDHPVVCVTWQDAHDYAAWVASRSHQRYRLLGEAEWEYAARAGTSSAFFWGDEEDAACSYANGGDRSLLRALPAWSTAISKAQHDRELGARILECDDGAGFTRAAGQLRANPFGLRDMTGNVWEWVEDCYESGSYEHLSADGQPPGKGDCKQHRARGGSWDDYPIDLRSARRTSGLDPSARRNDTGFRIARDVKP
ncbi:MAG: formylglycine-generating enzyme family protein [Dokdonella sp.]